MLTFNKTKWVWVAILALVLATLACGGGDGASGDTGVDEEEEATEEPVEEEEEPQPVEEEPASEDIASLEVINNLTFDLCYLYLAESSAGDFGDNQLESGTTIPAGTSFTLTDIPFGEYNIQVNDCNSSMVNALYGVNFDQDLFWELKEATLTVINSSSFNICELYISPNSAPETEWGPNQIEGDPLNTGEQVTFTLAEGKWDTRAVPCDASVEGVTQLGLDVAGEYEWTLSDK